MVPFVCLCSNIAGIIEGCSTVPAQERSLKGEHPSIQIALKSKDFPIVMQLCQVIRHGSISKKCSTYKYHTIILIYI